MRVTEAHLAQIAEMSSTFKKYMKSARQADDSDLASRLGLRDDTFKPVPASKISIDA